jgi:hypothetical protein
MPEQIYYAVLRVIPDPRRGEIVNIGVAAFLHDRLDIRLLSSLAKVRAIDPRIDLQALFELPRALESFVAPLDTVEQRHAVLAGFPGISVSDLGWFQLANPTDYEREIEQLLYDLVMPPAREYLEVARRSWVYDE